MQPKFALGRTVMTSGLSHQLAREYPDQEPSMVLLPFVQRHQSGDWGNMPAEDVTLNDLAVEHQGRLMSAYTTRKGTKFWIITEWDRSVTTALLPDDY